MTDDTPISIVAGGITVTGVDFTRYIQFKHHIQQLNDPKKAVIAAVNANNCIQSSSAFTHMVQVGDTYNVGFTYPTSFNANGVNDWPTKAKPLGAFPCFNMGVMGSMYRAVEVTMNPIIDGDYYEIPNMFLGSFEMDGHPTNWYFISNFADRQYINPTAELNKAIGMYVYAYKDGDPEQPWIILMTITNVANEAALYWIDMTPIRAVDYQNPEDIFAQFNLKYAEALRENVSFKGTQFLLGDTYDKNAPIVVPSFESWGEPTTFTAVKYEPSSSTIGMSRPQYMNVTSIVNDSDTTMTFKTPDYSLKITETQQYQWSNNEKVNINAGFTYKSSVKNTTKIKVGEFAEDTGEVSKEWSISVAVGFEYSHTSVNTDTHTQEQTYTIGGQTFQIPPRSAYNLVASFQRTSVEGKMKVYYPVDFTPTLKVVHKYFDRPDPVILNGKMNIAAVESGLKLKGFEDVETKRIDGKTEVQRCVWGEMPFKADNTSVCTLTLKYVGPTDEKK